MAKDSGFVHIPIPGYPGALQGPLTKSLDAGESLSKLDIGQAYQLTKDIDLQRISNYFLFIEFLPLSVALFNIQ